jgi:hypothetical protein
MASLLIASACAKPDPEADERVRILRAQLQQASAQIQDLQKQVHDQQDQLDLKIGACCTTGAVPDSQSEDNSTTDDDDSDVGNDTSDSAAR